MRSVHGNGGAARQPHVNRQRFRGGHLLRLPRHSAKYFCIRGWPDRPASPGKLGADLARQAGVLPIEGHDLEEQAVHAAKVVLLPLALERTVIQLVDRDGREADLAGMVGAHTASDDAVRLIQQRDDGVGVE